MSRERHEHICTLCLCVALRCVALRCVACTCFRSFVFTYHKILVSCTWNPRACTNPVISSISINSVCEVIVHAVIVIQVLRHPNQRGVLRLDLHYILYPMLRVQPVPPATTIMSFSSTPSNVQQKATLRIPQYAALVIQNSLPNIAIQTPHIHNRASLLIPYQGMQIPPICTNLLFKSSISVSSPTLCPSSVIFSRSNCTMRLLASINTSALLTRDLAPSRSSSFGKVLRSVSN
jgi:hypothetical protein